MNGLGRFGVPGPFCCPTTERGSGTAIRSEKADRSFPAGVAHRERRDRRETLRGSDPSAGRSFKRVRLVERFNESDPLDRCGGSDLSAGPSKHVGSWMERQGAPVREARPGRVSSVVSALSVRKPEGQIPRPAPLARDDMPLCAAAPPSLPPHEGRHALCGQGHREAGAVEGDRGE